MPATALYKVAMSPSEAFGYTIAALQASGVVVISQTPPAHVEFTLTRKDVETGTIDATMPGRALVAATDTGEATVTIVVDPATQFILYAVGFGLAALLAGGIMFTSFNGLWFLIVLAAEAYLFWAIFSKWPSDALLSIRTKMRASPSVSGGDTTVEPAGFVFSSTPRATDDIADKIRQLAELRDQGHLTQAEFDEKKTELLKRL